MTTHPSTELARLEALRALTFLHRPGQVMFDDITRLAAHVMDTPVAFVSLVEAEHQTLLGQVGTTLCQTSREVSFCSHAIARRDLSEAFVVPDTHADPLFANNPLVTDGPKIRFYAGQPLLTDGGHALGALCVVDGKPRQPQAKQLQALAVLGRSVVTLIEARRDGLALRASELRTRLVIEGSLDAVLMLDADGTIGQWNGAADAYFGLSALPDGQRTISRLFAPDTSAPDLETLVGDTGTLSSRRRIEAEFLRADGTTFVGEMNVVSISDDAGVTKTAYVRDLTHRMRMEHERREAETRDVVIYALARLAESRDTETGAHVERVSQYCTVLAKTLKAAGKYTDLIDDEFLQLLPATSSLHDIGKVGVPDKHSAQAREAERHRIRRDASPHDDRQ